MIEEARDCEDVVTQLAAASKALDRAGFKIVTSGMYQGLDVEPNEAITKAQIARMEQLFLSPA